jgi:lipoprotein-releasing system permease protein
MYKLLLSWRYLRTRFIALASIVSVTLGVATLIVVNSVMSGFVFEMKTRLHGILSDVEIAAPLLGQISHPDVHMRIIRDVLGDDIESMTGVVRSPAMVTFNVHGRQMTQQVMLLGIDDESFGQVTDFHPYLQNENKKEQFTFNLEESGYPDYVSNSGWKYRRTKAQQKKRIDLMQRQQQAYYDSVAADYLAESPGEFHQTAYTQPVAATDGEGREIEYRKLPAQAPDFDKIHGRAGGVDVGAEPQADVFTSPDGRKFRKFKPFDAHAEFRQQPDPEDFFDPEEDQHTGIILGIAISKRKTLDEAGNKKDFYMVRPGDDVQLIFATVGQNAKPVSENCTLVDFYSSNMHEYDSSFAFVPIKELQKVRGMMDPLTGDATVSSIQIKMKPGADLDKARDALIAKFPPEQYPYDIHTWQDTQRPLLSAVNMELTILNLLLFMIIAVAGFGILATFFMIVVEKTKDIGVLKALGAPSSGVMSIFLGYGMSLGMVGTGAGIVLGLLFVRYINEIAGLVQVITGQEVFDPEIYYFSQIPTIVSPMMVVLVGLGAISIAVLASVLPALRAARLHPVEALRYE